MLKSVETKVQLKLPNNSIHYQLREKSIKQKFATEKNCKIIAHKQ